jgi:Zn-dependent peptidase ImmA (M78 family)
LTLRGKSDDRFWFTFFHEAGHLLNDSRKETFVDVDYEDDPREAAANKFAATTLIPSAYDDRLVTLGSKAAVREFSASIGVAPGIVVGRMQRDGIIPYTHFNDLKVWLKWVAA